MKITIDETPEEHVLTDREGVELKSGEPFLFRCCDCSLVHQVVIVSQDSKPVGFAVQREPEITEERRQGPPTPDDWKFKLFQKLRSFYRISGGGGLYRTRMTWRPLHTPGQREPSNGLPQREITWTDFLGRLAQGLLSPGGRDYPTPTHPEYNLAAEYQHQERAKPGRSGIWREDASGDWTGVGARPQGGPR